MIQGTHLLLRLYLGKALDRELIVGLLPNEDQVGRDLGERCSVIRLGRRNRCGSDAESHGPSLLVRLVEFRPRQLAFWRFYYGNSASRNFADPYIRTG
jgi:hypothetical protein